MTRDKGTSFSFGFRLNDVAGERATNPFKAQQPTVTTSVSQGFVCETDEFVLNLGWGWEQFESEDPNQFSFYSESRKASVIASYVQAQMPREILLRAAQALADGRREAELAARPGVVFGDFRVEMVDDGGHVAYAGYDETSIFRFMGWATEAKFLNLWVSTEGHDNEHAKRVFDEVFAGFRFYVP